MVAKENMNNKNSKIFTLITLIIVALLCLPILSFALGNNDSVSSAWTFEPRQNSEGVRQSESVIFKRGEGTIDKLYLFIGNVYSPSNDKIDLIIDENNDKNSIESEKYNDWTRQKLELSVPKEGFHSWVELPLKGSISANYFKITTTSSFELYEVASFDKKGNFLALSCYGAKTYNDNNIYTFIPASAENANFTAVCDEQNLFATTPGLNALSQYELKVAGAIGNVMNQSGYYVSESENVLSVLINLPAVAIFGASPFGLRITGFLFFVATLFLLFFFAKELFENQIYAIFAVCLYMISGLSLSLVTNANGVTIAIFFLLSAFYFATLYFKRGESAKNVRKNVKHIVLSGLFFSLALATSLYSLFILPALAFLLIYPSVKGIIQATKLYKGAEGLEREYAREKMVKTISSVILCTLFAFVILPFVVLLASYASAYSSYCGYYGKNIFATLFANHARILSSQPKGLFLSWIIGLGKAEYSVGFGFSSYAFANRALTVLSFACLLTLAVLYILSKVKVIKNGELIVSLNDNLQSFLLVNIAFLSTYVLNAVLWGNNAYASFAISLIFLILNAILTHKILKPAVNKTLLKAITIVSLSIVGIFFVFQFTLIFKINLPEQISFLVNWLI